MPVLSSREIIILATALFLQTPLDAHFCRRVGIRTYVFSIGVYLGAYYGHVILNVIDVILNEKRNGNLRLQIVSKLCSF